MNDITRQERIRGKIEEFMTNHEKKEKRGKKRKGGKARGGKLNDTGPIAIFPTYANDNRIGYTTLEAA